MPTASSAARPSPRRIPSQVGVSAISSGRKTDQGAKRRLSDCRSGRALQEAAVVGLNFPQSYYDGLTELYTHKRQVFLDGLDRIGLKHTVPQGSYFVMVDISDFQKPGMRFHDKSDMEFCEWMIRTIGVAAVPGSSFFREPVNHLIRLHFARSEETLNEALERLAKLPKLV
ncbi:MAG: aminotransferase class I/II-fold pyridoxal phosphate-dependent enzyme [Christensenellales bacterium]